MQLPHDGQHHADLLDGLQAGMDVQPPPLKQTSPEASPGGLGLRPAGIHTMWTRPIHCARKSAIRDTTGTGNGVKLQHWNSCSGQGDLQSNIPAKYRATRQECLGIRGGCRSERCTARSPVQDR